MKKIVSGLIAGVLFVVALTVVFGSWYTVDQTERAVVLRNGAYVDTADPGLHWKTPWLSSVVTWPITQQVTYWTCASNSQSCHTDELREMQGYSQDQQPADIRVTISWHTPPDQVGNAYKEYGTPANLESRLIARRAPQDIKTVFGQYTAQTVIQDRARFNSDVQTLIEKDITGPVVVDSVQIENIDFSDAYEKSVEESMQARVVIQKLQAQQQQQEVAAKTTVINAQAAADAQVAQAMAQAKATQLQGEAQAAANLSKAQSEAKSIQLQGDATAAAIKAKGEALRDNPNIIDLTRAEQWDGKLPTSMIPGTTIPFLNIESPK